MMNRILLLALATTFAADTLAWRCGSSLVQEGDSMEDVVAACGPPAAQYTQQVAYEMEVGNLDQRRRYQSIDFWVYLPGSNRFARILYFEEGVVKFIQQGDYGRNYRGDADSCRRENSAIQLNQTKPELELRCGPPDDSQVVEEYTSAIVPDSHYRVRRNIVVDEWLYYRNADSSDKLRVYRFENGVLKWQKDADAEAYRIRRFRYSPATSQ